MCAKKAIAKQYLDAMWKTRVDCGKLDDGAEDRRAEVLLRDAEAVHVAVKREAVRRQLIRCMQRLCNETKPELANTGIEFLGSLVLTRDYSSLSPEESRAIADDLLGDVVLQVADQFLAAVHDETFYNAIETEADADAESDGDIVAYLASRLRADIVRMGLAGPKKTPKPKTKKPQKKAQK